MTRREELVAWLDRAAGRLNQGAAMAFPNFAAELADAMLATSPPEQTRDHAFILDGDPLKIAHEILYERQRQMVVEGFTTKHDERHSPFDLAMSAAAYVLVAGGQLDGGAFAPEVLASQAVGYWWAAGHDYDSFRPKHPPRRALVIAGALAIAAIERLDRDLVVAPDPEAG